MPDRFVSALNEEGKFSNTPYTYPKLVAVCNQLARQILLKQGGRIEKAEDGQEVFLIPVQKPRPSPLEQCWEPGPIADSRFSEAEMAKIVAQPRNEADEEQMAKAIETFAPGWMVIDCGGDMSPGLRKELAGKKNVLVTHPLDQLSPCILYKLVDVPEGKTTLHLVVGHHESGDWTLIVANGKEEVLLQTTVGSETSKNGWMNVDVDLSKFAETRVELA